ncbi:MAG: hypothetical protein WA982_13645, partial [Rubrobacteraceae bacterium]
MSFRSKFLLVFSSLVVALLLVAGCSEDQAPAPKEDNVAQSPPQAAQGIPEGEAVAQVASQV